MIANKEALVANHIRLRDDSLAAEAQSTVWMAGMCVGVCVSGVWASNTHVMEKLSGVKGYLAIDGGILQTHLNA